MRYERLGLCEEGWGAEEGSAVKEGRSARNSNKALRVGKGGGWGSVLVKDAVLMGLVLGIDRTAQRSGHGSGSGAGKRGARPGSISNNLFVGHFKLLTAKVHQRKGNGEAIGGCGALPSPPSRGSRCPPSLLFPS